MESSVAAHSPPAKETAMTSTALAALDPSTSTHRPSAAAQLDTTHLQSTSPHSAFSPEVRTPEAGPISPTHLPELFTFAKQPLRPRLPASQATTGYGSTSQDVTDSEAGLSDGNGNGHISEAGSKTGPPLSLLTALLQSPQHQRTDHSRSTLVSAGGIASARSSAPSTALSSPQAPHHGILQNQISQAGKSARTVSPAPPAAASTHPSAAAGGNGAPASILRRGSTSASSDGGDVAAGLGLGLHLNPEHTAAKLETVEEKRERIEWADRADKEQTSLSRAPSHKSTCLKFAVAPMTSHQVHSSSDADSSRHRRQSTTAHDSSAEAGRKRSASPFARERLAQSELDQEEDDEDGEGNSDAQRGSNVDADGTSEEEEEEVKLPGYTKAFGPAPFDPTTDAPRNDGEEEDASEESDLGYQEDEEDGMFSDEEDPVAFRLGAAPPPKSFPFARPTNYSRRRDRKATIVPSPSGSPPPAPAVLPPPPRRGRGHIRVMDPVSGGSGLETSTKPKGCSRHCSPPPAGAAGAARSRAGSVAYEYKAPPAASSPSARKLAKKVEKSVSPHRLSDAGPRAGRAGSPMPDRMLDLESDNDDEDDEEDENVEEGEGDEEEADDATPGADAAPRTEVDGPDQAESSCSGARRSSPQKARSGWRSDDSIFFGANSQQARNVIPARLDAMPRKSSAPSTAMAHQPVFDEEEEEPTAGPSRSTDERRRSDDAGAASEFGLGDGVRNFFRRASEHLPVFRRPSIAGPSPSPDRGSPFPAVGEEDDGASSGNISKTAPSLAQSATCPPALDDTPAIASSIKTNQDGYASDLAQRLEKTLGSYSQQPMLGDSLAPRPSADGRRLSISTASRPSSSSSAAGQPGQAGQLGQASALSRASSTVSNGPGYGNGQGKAGRVTFHPTAVVGGSGPAGLARAGSARAVSHTISSDEAAVQVPPRTSGAQRHVSEGSAPVPAASAAAVPVVLSKPIACPKLKKKEDDTGWTEGQLLNIRKHAGKGDDL